MLFLSLICLGGSVCAPKTFFLRHTRVYPEYPEALSGSSEQVRG